MIKNPTELFTDGWTAYEKVLKHNYLFHEEIYSDIKQYINSQNLKNSLNILEAGCGDASQTIKLFHDFDIQYYHGIDLSPFALEIAKKILNTLSAKLILNAMTFFFSLKTCYLRVIIKKIIGQIEKLHHSHNESN